MIGRFARAQAVAAMLGLAAIASAQPRPYTPPRILRAELPPEPAVTVAGGGEVLIEFVVDERGSVTRPAVLTSTPPFTQMLLAALARWRFEPARATDERGVERAVEAPLTISAIFRPPTLRNEPTLGERPRHLGQPSGDVAYPLAMVTPAYPPRAVLGAVLMYEIALDETGRAIDTRTFGAMGGFEAAAREAVKTLRFRGATYGGRPVPSVAYVLFGFRPPVVSSVR